MSTFSISIQDDHASMTKMVFIRKYEDLGKIGQRRFIFQEGEWVQTGVGSVVEPSFRLPIDTPVNVQSFNESKIDRETIIKEKDKHSSDLMELMKLMIE